MNTNTNFWSNVGSSLAKGTVATGKGCITGSVWLAKYTKMAAKHTSKAFSEEWNKQNSSERKEK